MLPVVISLPKDKPPLIHLQNLQAPLFHVRCLHTLFAHSALHYYADLWIIWHAYWSPHSPVMKQPFPSEIIHDSRTVWNIWGQNLGKCFEQATVEWIKVYFQCVYSKTSTGLHGITHGVCLGHGASRETLNKIQAAYLCRLCCHLSSSLGPF